MKSISELNDFLKSDTGEMHSLFEKHLVKSGGKTTIEEIKYRYAALKEIAVNGNKYKRGEYFFLKKSSFREGLMILSKDQSAREETIRKIKAYLDEKYNGGKPEEFFDVEFNKEFTKIKIYPFVSE